MMNDIATLQLIFSQFKTQGCFHKATPHGSGHINDTYLVHTQEKHCPDYILQRINHHIFTNPPAMINNIVQITQHIQNKLSHYEQKNRDNRCLTVINNIQNQPFIIDNKNNYWVCYIYIDQSHTYDQVKNPKQAYEGGKLIGHFLKLLHDFPIDRLHETLPNFHNIEFRINQFEKAVKENNYSRNQDCLDEIEWIRSHAEEMMHTMRLGKQGKISLRVVHNDTKFNNLLLDNEDNGICVIDLDTIMPGYIHYDFSDAVRTIANSSTEDERELNKIHFDINLFSAFCSGFFSEIKEHLHQEEIDSLAQATPLMPFLQGTRFLTDYLIGDHYYKIHFPKHNLQRAKAQLQLVRVMQENMQEITQIIYSTTAI